MGFDASRYRGAGLFENYTYPIRDAADPKRMFKARIRCDLVAAEIAALDARDEEIAEDGTVITPAKTTIPDFWDDIAPYVVSWNFQAENVDTGKLEDVPAPADAGGEVFAIVPPAITFDIYRRLKTGPMRALQSNAKN